MLEKSESTCDEILTSSIKEMLDIEEYFYDVVKDGKLYMEKNPNEDIEVYLISKENELKDRNVIKTSSRLYKLFSKEELEKAIEYFTEMEERLSRGLCL